MYFKSCTSIAIKIMEGCGHGNKIRCDHLLKKTKVMLYALAVQFMTGGIETLLDEEQGSVHVL